MMVGEVVVVDGEVMMDSEVEVEGDRTVEGGFVALTMGGETASTLLSLPLVRSVVANRSAIGNGIGSLSTEGDGIGSSTRMSGLDCFVPSLKNLDFLFVVAEVDER
jgi:hypothetical protein